MLAQVDHQYEKQLHRSSRFDFQFGRQECPREHGFLRLHDVLLHPNLTNYHGVALEPFNLRSKKKSVD